MRIGLDMFDEYPEGMLKYLKNYGFHFNKKATECALKHLKIKQSEQLTKNQVDQIITKYNIQIEEDILYDAVYVANIAKLLKSSILDEQHLALFIKEYLQLGNVFCKWYVSLIHEGIPIEWEDLI